MAKKSDGGWRHSVAFSAILLVIIALENESFAVHVKRVHGLHLVGGAENIGISEPTREYASGGKGDKLRVATGYKHAARAPQRISKIIALFLAGLVMIGMSQKVLNKGDCAEPKILARAMAWFMLAAITWACALTMLT